MTRQNAQTDGRTKSAKSVKSTMCPKKVTSEARLLISYSICCGGEQLEATEPDETIEYQMGQGLWPIQLELEMLNENVGTRLQVAIRAVDNVFGNIDPERVMQLQQQDFSQAPEPGELIEFELPDGETIEGQVLKTLGDQVEVDFNHPYAGRDLDIQIRIKSILHAD